MRRLIAVILASFLCFGAREPIVEYAPGEDNPELKSLELQEYPLKITCPICGFIYYYMTIPELFDGEIAKPEYFMPAQGIKPYEWSVEWEPCPNDGWLPIQSKRDLRAPTGWGSSFHTNKGWQPVRVKPIY